MTFTEIQDRASERLNITSTDGKARIGRFINDRYARLTSSIGLPTSRRTTVTAATVIGDPRVAFNLEKIERVYSAAANQQRVLDEASYDEWRAITTCASRVGTPWTYAIELQGASSVTIVLDPVPDAIETLSADGLANASALSGSNVPAFPADFHDALVFGAMADELEHLEKSQQAAMFEARHEQRLSDLRYFLAKSAYLQRMQGGRSRSVRRRSPKIIP